MAAVNAFVVLSWLVFTLFLLGIHNFLTGNEENGCQMTYMFQYPQYVKISLPPEITRQYPRYGLYAYGEGHHIEKLRQMKFSGIPVLFIPGNSGSHKQVRSLASVSLQKAVDSRTPFHFDYFSLDLNEEYSALFGGFFKDQRNFAHRCIHRILELYKNAYTKPTSVIIIGHSMGGMVAKALFTDSSFDKDLVKVLITIVTPHKAPVLMLDPFIARYYSEVNKYWTANRRTDGGGNLSHVTFVSIGGGHRDILVRSGLTEAKEADISVLSTAIPDVWMSTDHLCSVWCKELILVIVRSLFDIISLTSMQVMENIEERRNIFQYHMIHRTAGKRFSTAFHPKDVYFSQNGVWNEQIMRQFTIIEPNGVHLPTYIMIRLVDDPKHETAAIEAINSHDKDWIFVCRAGLIEAGVRKCFWGVNLSNKAVFLPSRNQKRKFMYLNLAALKQATFTHVIIAIQPTKEMVQFNIDIHSLNSRQLCVGPLPKWISFPFKKSVIDFTADGATYYDLAVPGLEQSWQAYNLYVTAVTCQGSAHHAVSMMEVPWSREKVHSFITDATSEPLHIKLQALQPLDYTSDEKVRVRLILDPSCKYTVQIQSSLLDSLGQLVRFYSPMLLAHIVAVLLLTVAHQLRMQSETGQFVLFHSAIAEGAAPYYILPAAKIATTFHGFIVLTKIFGIPDFVAMQDQNLDFLLLPLYLYGVAVAILYFLGLAGWVAIIFSGHTAHKMALRFVAKTITFPTSWSDWLLSGMSKLPVSVAGLLVFLAYRTCGSLGLCLGAGFFFLKLCKMYEDVLEDFFKYSIALIAKTIFPCKKKEENVKEKIKAKQLAAGDNQESDDKSADNVETIAEANRDKVVEDIKEDLLSDVNDAAKVVGNHIQDLSDREDSTESSADANDAAKVVGNHIPDLSDREDSTESSAVQTTESTSEEQKESSSKKKTKKTKKDNALNTLSDLHFFFTLLMLWLSVTLINLPSVLVWAHSYKYSSKLRPDPSLAIAVVLCLCAGILWQGRIPRPDMKGYNGLQQGLWFLALLALLYGPLSLYVLNYIVTTAFVFLTVIQFVNIFLPSSTTEVKAESPPPPSPSSGDKKEN